MKTTPDWQFSSAFDSGPKLKSPLWIRFAIVLTIINILVVVGAPLARLYLDTSGMTAFRIFFSALQAGVVLGMTGLIVAIFAVFIKRTAVVKSGLVLMSLGLLPATLVIVAIGPSRLTSPMIHDISTDTVDPPQFVEAKKLRTAEHNTVEYGGAEIGTQQQAAYPDLAPIHSSMNTDDALTEATQVVKDLSWEFINIDYDQGIVEAYDTTRLFGFVDDVVIRVRREGAGSRIDVRSVSRFGKGDLGKNADRIRTFIRTYRP
jgi:uncharacterized protein (DUF1499 family)